MSLPIEYPQASVDVAIFTVREGALHVLLVRRAADQEAAPGAWALPGGLVDIARDPDLESVARRKLREKTGVDTAYLEQVETVGSASRDPRRWALTTTYFALLPSEDLLLNPGSGCDAAEWVPLRQGQVARPLAFDHARLLATAAGRLRAKATYTLLPARLLGAEFTLPELIEATEAILETPLQAALLRRRALRAGVLIDTGRQRSLPRRPAALYRLAEGAEAFCFTESIQPPEALRHG